MLVVDSDADEQGFLAAAALPQVAVVVYPFILSHFILSHFMT